MQSYRRMRLAYKNAKNTFQTFLTSGIRTRMRTSARRSIGRHAPHVTTNPLVKGFCEVIRQLSIFKCQKCQTRRKSRTYASKSRAKKDGNLRKCHELLRWAIDEVNKQRGQIHSLRNQLKELLAQLECRYSEQNINLSLPTISANISDIGLRVPPSGIGKLNVIFTIVRPRICL